MRSSYLLWGFLIGLMFGIATPKSMWRSWYDETTIYIGDTVKYLPKDNFYNTCKYAKVIGLYQDIAWVLFNDCDIPGKQPFQDATDLYKLKRK